MPATQPDLTAAKDAFETHKRTLLTLRAQYATGHATYVEVLQAAKVFVEADLRYKQLRWPAKRWTRLNPTNALNMRLL